MQALGKAQPMLFYTISYDLNEEYCAEVFDRDGQTTQYLDGYASAALVHKAVRRRYPSARHVRLLPEHC